MDLNIHREQFGAYQFSSSTIVAAPLWSAAYPAMGIGDIYNI